jgi:L-fuculose-phosphate aldolase
MPATDGQRFVPERAEVAAFMRRLYRQQLTTTSGGNISLRVDDRHVLLTASKRDKGRLRWADVGILSLAGENLSPELVPSIELSMHLSVYRQRPDVKAIIHAHPITASAFCATSRPINCHLTSEAYAILGEPAYLPYACMGTEALAATIAGGIGNAACVLMANHGVMCTGRTLLEAFDRIEVLEATARINVIAQALGGVRDLNVGELAVLDQAMGRRE